MCARTALRLVPACRSLPRASQAGLSQPPPRFQAVRGAAAGSPCSSQVACAAPRPQLPAMAANTGVNTFAAAASHVAAPRRGRFSASRALAPAAAGRPTAVALRAGRQVRLQPRCSAALCSLVSGRRQVLHRPPYAAVSRCFAARRRACVVAAPALCACRPAAVSRPRCGAPPHQRATAAPPAVAPRGAACCARRGARHCSRHLVSPPPPLLAAFPRRCSCRLR